MKKGWRHRRRAANLSGCSRPLTRRSRVGTTRPLRHGRARCGFSATATPVSAWSLAGRKSAAGRASIRSTGTAFPRDRRRARAGAFSPFAARQAETKKGARRRP